MSPGLCESGCKFAFSGRKTQSFTLIHTNLASQIPGLPITPLTLYKPMSDWTAGSMQRVERPSWSLMTRSLSPKLQWHWRPRWRLMGGPFVEVNELAEVGVQWAQKDSSRERRFPLDAGKNNRVSKKQLLTFGAAWHWMHRRSTTVYYFSTVLFFWCLKCMENLPAFSFEAPLLKFQMGRNYKYHIQISLRPVILLFLESN